jgi:hypothetical protein
VGKYDSVIKYLPKVRKPFEDEDHQTRVNAAKLEIEKDVNFKRQAAWLFSRYATLRRVKDEISEELSECQVQLDAVTQLMEDQMEVEGTESLGLSNGDKVRLEPGIYPKIVDREAFRLWCLADEDLSKKMMLHAKTAESLVRKMLLAGEPEPPGMEAVSWNKVVFTKGGP